MNSKKTLPIAVLGSGRGTNFQAIADAIEAGKLNARIACVLSDVPDAMILERATKMGIPAEYIDHSPYKTKLDGTAELKMIEKLKANKVELIALAGYMRILKKKFLATFPWQIINIHPSLLPSFPGLDAWKQAFNYGVRITGCTVHFIDAGMDTGPIILQKAVQVHEADDTAEKLHARIQEQEHLAYPEAIRMIIEGCAKINRR